MRGTPTMVSVPPGASASSACRMTARLPTHSKVYSAPPPVRSRTAASASSREASTTCVAPKRRASSSFCGLTSMAMIGAAPASTPPCTQLSPMPPTPKTAIDAPASTRARFSTAPTPVMIPHPIRAARSNGTRGSTGMALCSRTSVSSAKAEALANWYAGVPRIANGVVSFGLGAWRHAVGLPPSHAAHRPQCASVDRMTASPSFTLVTPGPTASTTPAPSCPSTTGTGYGMVPLMTLWSEWQRPAARIATRTSPGAGSRTLTSSMATPRAGPGNTAAFMSGRVPDAARAAGSRTGELAVLHDHLSVHHDAHDAFRLHLPALLASRQVGDELLLPEPDARRIEHEDVGVVAACQQPAQRDAADHRGQVRDASDAFLEAHVLAIEQPRAQEVRRPLGAIVPVGVRAAVARADDHVRIALRLAVRLDPGRRLRVPQELRGEAVGQRQLAHDVGGMDAALLGELGEALALRAGIAGR